MGRSERDDAKAIEYSTDTVRWALVLGIAGVLIIIATRIASHLAMMMLFDEMISHSELGAMLYRVYQVSFVGSVLVTVGFIGLARKHGSTLGWVFLATWLVSTAWVYYVTPVIASIPYYSSAAFVEVLAIALANSYVLWTIRQSTVHPLLTVGVVLGRLAGPSIATMMTFLLLEWIWPFESGMDYLMYSSIGILVFALTSILTLLLFVVELRRLNQTKYLGPELESFSP